MSPINKINIPIKPTSIIVSSIGLLSELKYGLSIEANKESPSSTFVAISQENLCNVYIAESSFSDGDIKSKFRLISSDLFKREGFPEDCHFVGEGCALFPEVINVLPGAIPKSKYLLEIAKKRLNKSELIEPEEILPVYLNDENSWNKIK